MEWEENTLQAQLESEQHFAKFLNHMRIEENISLEQLSKGLMSASQLARIEKAERPVNKSVRDRLLERLGIARDEYENLLNVTDYRDWEHQKNILCAIENDRLSLAEKLLTQYERQLKKEDKISQQFCFVMRAEILKKQEAETEKIVLCYERAVGLTVPEVPQIWKEKRPLSTQEINILLEFIFYGTESEYLYKCEILMEYAQLDIYDEISKAKIYPKILYYYLREQILTVTKWSVDVKRDNLKKCEKALEILRDTGRTFYLIELLELKLRILKECPVYKTEKEEVESACTETAQLINIMKKLNREYGVSEYMKDCTYLYRQRWIFCIGDVLKIRREMYGLTQEQLCEGVCSVKTLRRAEKKERDMQKEILNVLLNRLGLSSQAQRARLITNNREVISLLEQMAECQSNRELQTARKLLEEIKKKTAVEILQNKQFFLQAEAIMDFEEGKITQKELVEKEKEALYCTLKTKKFLQLEQIYLTEGEIYCIRNVILGLEIEEKKEVTDFLLRFLQQMRRKNEISDAISAYEFVTEVIVNELGDMGEHTSAVEIDKKAIRESLKCRRAYGLAYKIYDIWWNDNEMRQKKNIPSDERQTAVYLTECLFISHFIKNNFYEEIFREKLSTICNIVISVDKLLQGDRGSMINFCVYGRNILDL